MKNDSPQKSENNTHSLWLKLVLSVLILVATGVTALLTVGTMAQAQTSSTDQATTQQQADTSAETQANADTETQASADTDTDTDTDTETQASADTDTDTSSSTNEETSDAPGSNEYKGLGDDNQSDIKTERQLNLSKKSFYSLKKIAPKNTKTSALSQKENAKDAEKYNAAVQLANNFHLVKSEKALQALIKEAPDYRLAWVGLIKILIQNNKETDALKIADEGVARFPNYIPIIILKARADMLYLKFTEAEALLEKYSPPLKGNIDYYMTLAVISQRLGKYLYATQLYLQLLQYDDDNGLWWLGAAMNLESAGKNNSAKKAYNRALATRTLNPTLSAYANMQVAELD